MTSNLSRLRRRFSPVTVTANSYDSNRYDTRRYDLLKDDATPYEAATTGWKKQTFGYHWLRKQAADHDDLSNCMAFLKTIGVVPGDENYGRTNSPGACAAPHITAIPAQYLAEFANDWDRLGPATPTEFIAALEFECVGSTKRDLVAEVLAELGASIQQESALDDALAAA